jgi:hypothetical protein
VIFATIASNFQQSFNEFCKQLRRVNSFSVRIDSVFFNQFPAVYLRFSNGLSRGNSKASQGVDGKIKAGPEGLFLVDYGKLVGCFNWLRKSNQFWTHSDQLL